MQALLFLVAFDGDLAVKLVVLARVDSDRTDSPGPLFEHMEAKDAAN
jgi:hypothetical protein